MLAYIKKILKKICPGFVIKKYKDFKKQRKPLRLFFNNQKASIDFVRGNYSNVCGVYYWDDKENFGDSIGPYIVSKITGRPVFNIMDLSVPGIMSVGSILQRVDRKGLTILGSGFIEPPSGKVINQIIKNKPLVLSVRGKLTKNKLDEIGIDTPDDEFLGDPAVIMPLLYQPKRKEKELKKQIGIVPHYIHKKLFEEINANTFQLIDVQRDLESVIDDITSSNICISTSLHGVIIAQAYGIPWLWLEIKDDNLVGDDFKFNDFFSMLGSRANNHVVINSSDIKNINVEELSKKAFLPTSLYDSEKILSVFIKYLNVEFSGNDFNMSVNNKMT